MRFSTMYDCVAICREADISLMIWGHRGVGKSSLVTQYCNRNQLGCINMRLSQMEASDIRGLPDRVEGRTQYLPPADMPNGGMSWEEYETALNEIEDPAEKMRQSILLTPNLNDGILFLDEINRAQDDVLQAAFELVLDKKVGQYVLPIGWSIVCAGNYDEGSYITNGFSDAAFLDRFCHVQLSDGNTTLDEWAGYIADKHGDAAQKVIEFAAHDLKRLDGDVQGNLGFSVQPSRRSWEAVIRVMKACQKLEVPRESQMATIQGLIGMEMGQAFESYSSPVNPRDIIRDGVDKWKTELSSLTRGQQIGLTWGLVSYLKDKIDEEYESNIILDFAAWAVEDHLEHDVIAGFLKALVESSGDPSATTMKQVMITNPDAAKMISGILKSGKGDKNETFFDRLQKRPELHDIISKVTWGIDDEEEGE